MDVRCEGCGELHDVEALEPSLIRPDAYLAVPEADRDRRTKASDDFCMVQGIEGAPARWFVRALLAFPVLGLEQPCRWGIWCETSAKDFARIQLLWDDPDQCSHRRSPPRSPTISTSIRRPQV